MFLHRKSQTHSEWICRKQNSDSGCVMNLKCHICATKLTEFGTHSTKHPCVCVRKVERVCPVFYLCIHILWDPLVITFFFFDSWNLRSHIKFKSICSDKKFRTSSMARLCTHWIPDLFSLRLNTFGICSAKTANIVV